ncbi:pseudaminic acid cytidylyltransferase [Salinimonas lutimaris]|uniref:pseudaminic acid cytidylyltransferase n=1 Tax=Salinimonas lutimaris TaxID=914153 RepID=UPI0010C01A0C|nr:pseudaminic acid cytidylyltransferase [Salinimonas lutimaris]
MNIAIIPARGGSKRIPRKNIKSFCGIPMIAHSIRCAQKSNVIDKVVVSTDDEDIAQIALQEGACVPFLRPAHLADDFTGTAEVMCHAVETLIAQKWQLDYCACIYATAPFLTPSVIDDSLCLLQADSGITNVFTATRFAFPIQRALLKASDGGVVPFDASSIEKRSQDLAPAFHDAGQLYWSHESLWRTAEAPIFSPTSRLFELPDYLVCDIDTTEDWERAEVMHDVLQKQGKI